MLVRIVGLQRQDWKMDDGFEFHGYKFHCVDEGTQNKDLQGRMVLEFKVPDGHPLSSMPIQLNKLYKAYFNNRKQLDFLSLSEDVAPSDILDEPTTKTK